MVNVKVKSVVKGYHRYRVKPESGTVCTVTPISNSAHGQSLEVKMDGNIIVGHVPAHPPINAVFWDFLDLHPSFPLHW